MEGWRLERDIKIEIEIEILFCFEASGNTDNFLGN